MRYRTYQRFVNAGWATLNFYLVAIFRPRRGVKGGFKESSAHPTSAKSRCRKKKRKECGRERSAFTRLRRGTQERWNSGGEGEKNCPVVEVNIFRS